MECLNLVIPATPSAIPAVTDDVTHLLETYHWSEDEILKVDLALQEALANAVRHGCGGDATKFVGCTVSYREAGDVRTVVRDPGPGFDLRDVPNPLEGANPLKPSGRGIILNTPMLSSGIMIGWTAHGPICTM